MTIYLDTAAHRQLRMLELEQSQSVQDLMTEATNDLFQKHGKARLANRAHAYGHLLDRSSAQVVNCGARGCGSAHGLFV